MRLAGNRRGIYLVSGVLLMTLVVTSGSLLTYALISPEIQKAKDRNNLDLMRNVLRNMDTNIRELLISGPNSSVIFRASISHGMLAADPVQDALAYTVKTEVSYDPGSTSNLLVTIQDGILTMASELPVDLVTQNTRIRPGLYTVILTFERESRIRIDSWTLNKNTTIPGTVGSTTGSYYVSELNESIYGVDINGNGATNDVWTLYMSDPNEEYVFDRVGIHDSTGTLIEIVGEGDTAKLNGVPLMVYRVRERYVVLRYARIRMEVK